METTDRTPENTNDHKPELICENLAARTRGNALTPIGRVPDENLSSIFFLLSNEPNPRTKEGARWDWLELTKVCRQWRDAALNCSILWVNIRKFSCIDRIQAFIERSKNADINVDLALKAVGTSGIGVLQDEDLSIINTHKKRQAY